MNRFEETHIDYRNHIGISNTNFVSHEYKIGINNFGDASQYLDIFNNLYPLFNIIITRDLSSAIFRQLLIKHKDNIILHIVVSGYGNSLIEPYTPHPRQMYAYIQQLINAGFDKRQIVLRIDPVIPNQIGLSQLNNVLEAFAPLRIKRCRYKLFLYNNNISNRINWRQLITSGMFINPYHNQLTNTTYYSANKYLRNEVNTLLNKWKSIYEFESCDNMDLFDSDDALGCISHKDFKVFGLTESILLPNNRNPKNHCKCPINKSELIKKSTQCNLQCLHCVLKTKI